MYTTVEKVLFLRKVDLLFAARTEDLSRLASIAEEVLYPEGAMIFEEGQPADGLYVIIRGHVALLKDGDEIVSLGEEEALGAWSLFEAEPPVTSARATRESLLLRVDREDFYDLLLDYPEMGESILKALVRRFRKLVKAAGA
jgi:CRP/FNR family cyclic AMP-dependent transcriptional regulator